MGSENVYQLVPLQSGAGELIVKHLRGGTLFSEELSFNEFEKQYYSGAKIMLHEDGAAALA